MTNKKTAPEPKQHNVVQFTKKMSPQQAFDAEATIKQVIEAKQEACDEIHEFVMESLIMMLSNFGMFLNTGKSNPKDMILLEQAVLSLLYRHHSVPHQFHDIVDDLIRLPEESVAQDDVEAEMEQDDIG